MIKNLVLFVGKALCIALFFAAIYIFFALLGY
jgi:hypothetical protein